MVFGAMRCVGNRVVPMLCRTAVGAGQKTIMTQAAQVGVQTIAAYRQVSLTAQATAWPGALMNVQQQRSFFTKTPEQLAAQAIRAERGFLQERQKLLPENEWQAFEAKWLVMTLEEKESCVKEVAEENKFLNYLSWHLFNKDLEECKQRFFALEKQERKQILSQGKEGWKRLVKEFNEEKEYLNDVRKTYSSAEVVVFEQKWVKLAKEEQRSQIEEWKFLQDVKRTIPSEAMKNLQQKWPLLTREEKVAFQDGFSLAAKHVSKDDNFTEGMIIGAIVFGDHS